MTGFPVQTASVTRRAFPVLLERTASRTAHVSAAFVSDLTGRFAFSHKLPVVLTISQMGISLSDIGDHMTRELPTENGPLAPLPTALFFVLFALADADKHGYRIMQDIRELSGGTVDVGPATLYTTIKKLSDQGLISETSEWAEDRRRTYSLTSDGRRLLRAEFRRQEQLLARARKMKVLKIGEEK